MGALNLYLLKGMDEPHLSANSEPDAISTPNHKTIQRFTKACKALLEEDGVLYFSQGNFNDLGLLCLFNAFRKNKLGIDWQHTYSISDGQGPDFSFKEMHLFMKSDQQTIFKNAREDLTTFLFSAKMPRFSDKIVLGHGDFEPWLGLLSDGTKLADIRVRKEEGHLERFSVYVKSGMLGFFSSHSKGGRSGFIYNAAAFESAVIRLNQIVQIYREQNTTITKEFRHPYFKAHNQK